jgi:hypothetical protein
MRLKAPHLILLAAAGVLLVVGGLLIALQSPRMINGLAAALENQTGYRVRLRAISFNGLRAEIEGLEVRELREGTFALSCAHVSVKGAMGASLRGEVETLVLTGPKFSFIFQGKSTDTDLSAIENLPLVRSLVIQDGEVQLVFPPHQVTARNLHVDVTNFSPKAGGRMLFSGSLHLASKAQGGLSGSGLMKGSATLTRLFPGPEGQADFEVRLDSPSFGIYASRTLAAELPLRLMPKQLSIERAGLRVAGVRVSTGGRPTELGEMALEGSGSYGYASQTVVMSALSGSLPALGIFRGQLELTLKDVVPWQGSVSAPSVDFAAAFSLLRPFLPPEYARWSVQGKGTLDASLAGSLASDPVWKGDVTLTMKDGGFSSPDSTRAGQGLTGKVVLKIRPPEAGPKKQFNLSLEAGGGECLWGSFYKDFKGQRLHMTATGLFTYAPSLECEGSTDLFGTGTYAFTASFAGGRSTLSVSARGISHGSIFSFFLEPYFRQNSPELLTMEVDGQSDLDARLTTDSGSTTAEGRLVMACPALKVPGVVNVSGLALSLPFELSYPARAEADDRIRPAEGRLAIARVERPGIELNDISLAISLWGNTLAVLSPLELSLFGGRLLVPRFSAGNLLGASPTIDTALQIENMDLGRATGALEGLSVPGTLRAGFPRIDCRNDLCTAEGKIEATVFGGTVEVTSLGAKKPFSRGRTLQADIAFSDISLEEATREIQIGKITGSIMGSLKGFQMEYGQPSRFVLDIKSDDTRKVDRAISVDAIKNISVLGTGSSAIDALLSSGINRFFSEYPYSRIGIHCTLENDTFVLRGTIKEGNREYLIRRAFLRGIDIVNQNPDNSISFRDMQERVGRIFKPREAPKNVS